MRRDAIGWGVWGLVLVGLATQGLDYLAAGGGITAFTLIRRRVWYGWAVTMCTQCVYTYLVWASPVRGFTVLYVFNFCNAMLALYQWRLRASVGAWTWGRSGAARWV